MTAVRLVEVVAPGVAIVDTTATSGYAWARVQLEGEAVTRWSPGARIVTVKPLGRAGAGAPHGDLVRLQLLAAEPCANSSCAEWLRLPQPLKSGDRP